jgi:hypothetical protein
MDWSNSKSNIMSKRNNVKESMKYSSNLHRIGILENSFRTTHTLFHKMNQSKAEILNNTYKPDDALKQPSQITNDGNKYSDSIS